MSTDPDEGHEELLQTLDEAACMRLMAATEFGRIAVVVADRPKIIVLNHLVHDGDVLFRTRDDALLAELTAAGPVPATYEVDSAFPVGHAGWSVIATGLLTREEERRRVTAAREHVVAWAEGDRDLVLRLDVEELTGRRAGRE